MTYEELIEKSEGQLEFAPVQQRSLKLVGKTFPHSVTEKEWEIIYHHVKEYDRKFAVEIATGTGVSTLAIGCGMVYTGGRVITIDSYIEESVGSHDLYRDQPGQIYSNNFGGQVLKKLIQNLKLDSFVYTHNGWSPDDVPKILSDYKEKLDFVFIDGGHFDTQLLADIDGVLPFLGKNYSVFIHDKHCFSDKTIAKIEEKLGGKFEIVCPMANGDGFNLALLVV